ncbi:MAG: RNA polymerase sigma-54 factor, partial [Runella slithyformis]
MQKLSLNQSIQQKLSPQQIQFIKLLQIPTAELNARIEEEMEVNPALEEGMDVEQKEQDDDYQDSNDSNDDEYDDYERPNEISIDEYLSQDEYGGYKMQGDGNYN